MPVPYFPFLPDGTLCVRTTPERFPYDEEAAAQKGQEQALRLKTRAAGYGLAPSTIRCTGPCGCSKNTPPSLGGRIALRRDPRR